MPKLFAKPLFNIIQFLGLLPMIVGYVLFVIQLARYSRRTRISATVLASFYTRWVQHQIGQRRDEPCARLMRVLPNVSQVGLYLLTGPTIVGARLTGYVPPLYKYPYQGVPPMMDQTGSRTTFYDAAMQRHLPYAEQLVVLGAGLDTRSYRLPADLQVRCFEVDAPRTQQFKRAMLRRAGVDSSAVTFAPADFERDDWLARLQDAGFDPSRPTLFLWESVTMYLDRAAVETTLRKIAGLAPGTAIAFDYFSTQLLRDRSFLWRYAHAFLAAVGEPFGEFGIDNTPPIRHQVAEFLDSCGLTLEEDRTFGRETNRARAEAGFAIAVVPANRSQLAA